MGGRVKKQCLLRRLHLSTKPPGCKAAVSSLFPFRATWIFWVHWQRDTGHAKRENILRIWVEPRFLRSQFSPWKSFFAMPRPRKFLDVFFQETGKTPRLGRVNVRKECAATALLWALLKLAHLDVVVNLLPREAVWNTKEKHQNLGSNSLRLGFLDPFGPPKTQLMKLPLQQNSWGSWSVMKNIPLKYSRLAPENYSTNFTSWLRTGRPIWSTLPDFFLHQIFTDPPPFNRWISPHHIPNV